MARLKGLHPNLNALLDMLGWAEGTSSCVATLDDGYDIVVTGIDGKFELMRNYDDHPFANGRPSKKINSHGLTSNAAGKYQIMLRDWPHYKAMLHLRDFSPESQDLYAIQIIRETGALPLIFAGKIREAIEKIAHLWASLPGRGYANQRQRSMDSCILIYEMKGGKLWSSLDSSLEPEDGLPPSPLPSPPSSPSLPNPNVTDAAKPMPPTNEPTPIGWLGKLLQWLNAKNQR